MSDLNVAGVENAVAEIPPAEHPSASAHVMVVDDDPEIGKLISDYLEDHEFRVTTLGNGRDITALLGRESIDLMILDFKLPGEDGVQITRRLRRRWDLPILMLTGRKDEADRVMALELGADDYVTKPFSLRELLARLRALLRRAKVHETVAEGVAKVKSYRFAGWQLNVRLRQLITPEGRKLACTKSEFNLLAAFLSAPQRVLTREQLIDQSRLYNDEVYDRSIDVQVLRLRKKLSSATSTPSAAPLIRTERGTGYVFTAAVEAVR